jgi:hypothetical protein
MGCPCAFAPKLHSSHTTYGYYKLEYNTIYFATPPSKWKK